MTLQAAEGPLRKSAVSQGLFLALLMATTDARAAKIELAPAGQAGKLPSVTLSGKMEPGDFASFREKTEGLAKAVVVLTSDGGSLIDGIEIGTMIRLKGYSAFVPDGSRCASACALAWLGGVPRVMAPTAKIGFHGAYIVKGGATETTSAGNALVGAYLNRLGLSDQAIVYITYAAPKDITWLSFADAAQLGVDVASTVPRAPAATAPATSANSAPASPPTTAPPSTNTPGDAKADVAPEPGSPERSAFCSDEADKRDLHGNERRRFRDRCKRGTASD